MQHSIMVSIDGGVFCFGNFAGFFLDSRALTGLPRYLEANSV
jgi:hypothetical protein